MEHYAMKNTIRRIVPLILTVCIIICIGWYLFVYDRTFTRDVLLSWARYFDGNGNTKVASVCYDLAYTYSGNDEEVAIELANQYISDGNYTKAEVTLTNAIADGGEAEVYIALCKTYVDQDKLLDAVNMLDNITDPAIKEKLDALRPSAPTASPEAGFFNQYISVEISCDNSTLYCNTEGQYPSTQKDLYTQPITLGGGETVIYAIGVADNGLVSPVSVLSYTINGVIEPAVFQDSAMEAAVRSLLGVDSDKELYTNDLWQITEFTVPDGAETLDDLRLLSYLENLTVQNRRISTLSVLSSLSSLETLDLSGSRFSASELSVLAKLPKLKNLTLSNCGLSTIADLEGASLEVLDLSSNTLRNLSVLSDMTAMTELNLQHNAVTDLDALSTLTDLTTLDISHNAVTSLSPLESCTRLNWLDASNNSIATLSAVDRLPELRYLALNYNKLTDIELLSNCSALTELHFNNNEVTYITCLSNMSNIEVLDFAYNNVYHIPIWNDGGALRIIDGSHNHIANIDTLWRMQSLTYIYMDYNKLTGLEYLERCTNLVMINAYGNQIRDVSHLTSRGIIVNYDPTA